MIACATMISPPAPKPCSARQRMSCSIVVEKPGEHAADHEETDTGLEDDLPSEEVTELAEQRRRDRLRE